MRRFGFRLAAAGIVAVTLAACGGDKGAGSNADNGSGTTAAGAGAGAPGTQPVDTKFTGAGSADYCKLARTYQDASSKIGAGASPDLRQLFQDAARDIKAAVDVAPAEIKKDVQTVADGFTALVGALATVNYDFTKLPPDLIVRFQSQDFMNASTRVGAYSKTVCGIGG